MPAYCRRDAGDVLVAAMIVRVVDAICPTCGPSSIDLEWFQEDTNLEDTRENRGLWLAADLRRFAFFCMNHDEVQYELGPIAAEDVPPSLQDRHLLLSVEPV